MRVRVKICGLREPEQAAAIAAAGADAIGLVFADSPRRVTMEQARDVADAVGPFVSRVGVFVDTEAAVANSIAECVGLSHIQLHGDASPQLISELNRPVVLGMQVRDTRWVANIRALIESLEEPRKISAILLDTYKSGMAGGTGEAFNWELVADARALKALEGLPPIILAGGLNCDNVLTGISVVQPWAVDVSSGVESSPGVKDTALARKFVKMVHDEAPADTGWF